VLDPDQAVVELTHAVEIALDVIVRGERGSNEDAFVNAILAEAAEKTKNDDFDGAAKAVDDAFADLERRKVERREVERRAGMTILEAAIRQHTLRRDAATVAARIERLVAVEHATDRPAWHPNFRARYDEYWEDGEAKGINFSLEVAIACARRMIIAARNSDELGTATFLFGTAFWRLGERESGTARLEKAVVAYRAALTLTIRERVPSKWAATQNSLGTALETLGEREGGTAHLEAAIVAYRNALQEWTWEQAPLQWAGTQNGLGNALRALGERESGTAHLEAAIDAYRSALHEWTRERMPLHWAGAQTNLGKRFGRSGSARAALHGLRRLLMLAVQPSTNGPAKACASLGGSADQPRQCPPGARRTRERHRVAGTGGQRLSRRAAGTDA
jgi:tetratricopeptide (TPR) repeat protein